MKKNDNVRVYAWIEFIIWLVIAAVVVFGIRFFNYNVQKQYKSYQIFMSDVDGLIVGSPVRFLGVRIGHVTKIQLISSNVYIKFIVTQKDLKLPKGSVATVEGSGLGGSKSLEIYPPSEETSNTDMLIVSKDSTRLNKVIRLFLDIFSDIDEIIYSFTNASKELNSVKAVPKNIVTPADNIKNIEDLNKKLDKFSEMEQNINKLLPQKRRTNSENENESEQSKSN